MLNSHLRSLVAEPVLLPAETLANGQAINLLEFNLDTAERASAVVAYLQVLSRLLAGPLRVSVEDLVATLRENYSLEGDEDPQDGHQSSTVDDLLRLTVLRALSGSITVALAADTLAWLLHADYHHQLDDYWVGMAIETRRLKDSGYSEGHIRDFMTAARQDRNLFPESFDQATNHPQ